MAQISCLLLKMVTILALLAALKQFKVLQFSWIIMVVPYVWWLLMAWLLVHVDCF